MSDEPRKNAATFHVLAAGYHQRGVASTVGLIRDGAVTAVVDPGMVRDRSLILDPLGTLGVQPEEVTDVVFSHHHPDHTINAALFPSARYHDHWAYYQGDGTAPRQPGPRPRRGHARAIPGHGPAFTPSDATPI